MGLFDKITSTAKNAASNIKSISEDAISAKAKAGMGTAENDRKDPSSAPSPEKPKFEVFLKPWHQNEPAAREFDFKGITWNIPVELDRYNSIRKQFDQFSDAAMEQILDAYDANITDLNSFLDLLPGYYAAGVAALAQRAVDGLIANGIYTISPDQFAALHIENHDAIANYYATVSKKIEEVSEKNALSSPIGILANQASEFMKSENAKAIIGEVAGQLSRQISSEQAQSIFEATADTRKQLLRAMGADYSDMADEFVAVLCYSSSIEIWTPPQSMASVEGTLGNITNPAFPKDRLHEVFTDIFLMNPYYKKTREAFCELFGADPNFDSIWEYFARC